MEKNNDNRSVTEKVNEVLEKFSHSELKKETALPWALAQINSCVGKVRILNENGGFEEVDSFKRAPAFDGDTMNFHVFPVCGLLYDVLFNSISNKRKEVMDKLNEALVDCEEFKKFKENENISKNNKSNIRVGKWNGKEIKLFSTGTTLSDLKKTYKGFVDLTSNNAFYVLAGAGSKDQFTQYRNWYNVNDENKNNFGDRSNKNLYKCIAFFYNQRWYYLNFMRFHQTEDGKVNCDFKSLQYDCVVCGKGVNSTNDTNVCDVCYPYSSANGECHVNSVDNICYNPTVSFYNTPDEIINNFINFIEACDELITSKKEINKKILAKKINEIANSKNKN